jgi:hypothetical protein
VDRLAQGLGIGKAATGDCKTKPELILTGAVLEEIV